MTQIRDLDEAEQYLDIDTDGGRNNQYYRLQVAERAFAIADTYLEQDPDNGSDAVAYLDGFAGPALHRYLGLDYEQPDIIHWTNRAADDLGDRPYNHTFMIDFSPASYTDLHTSMEELWEPDRFDIVAGLHDSGHPLAYAATTYFNADPILLTYDEDSDELVIPDAMTDETAFDDSSVLIPHTVSRDIPSMEAAARYLIDRGATDIHAIQIHGKNDRQLIHDTDADAI